MSDYRLYFLGRSGHILRAVPFSAPSDERAIVAAKKEMDGSDAELWQLSRLVRKFDGGALGERVEASHDGRPRSPT